METGAFAMKMNRIVAFFAAGATTLGIAGSAQAAHLYWTYDRVASVEACLDSARQAAQAYGASNIRSTNASVMGAIDDDIMITFFCLPAPQGATGLLVVAGDQTPDLPTEDVMAVRDELWSLFLR